MNNNGEEHNHQNHMNHSNQMHHDNHASHHHSGDKRMIGIAKINETKNLTLKFP